jgi:hypothetical protein
VWIALSLLLAAQVALFVLHQRAGERADAAQMRLLGQIEAFETKTQQLADSIGAKSQDIDSLRGAVESLRDDTRQGAEASTATSPSTPSTSSTRRPPRPPLTSSTRRPPATPIVPNIGSSPLGNLTDKRK